jgi:hypothetical protein
MDGMLVRHHQISTGGRGRSVTPFTIRLPQPTSVIAQITLGTFDTASAEFGRAITAFGVFTGCTTTGVDAPLPPVEVFAHGSLSGPPAPVLIRNGLVSLDYVLEVANASADFIVNLYFWPGVTRN